MICIFKYVYVPLIYYRYIIICTSVMFSKTFSKGAVYSYCNLKCIHYVFYGEPVYNTTHYTHLVLTGVAPYPS